MGEERRNLHAAELQPVVACLPEIVPVAGGPVHAREQLAPEDVLVRPVALGGVAAVDELVEHIHVLAHVAAGMAHEAVGAVVAVVRGVGRDGNDRREAFDARGRRRQAERAVVRGADHADLAGRPRGLDLVAALARGVALRAAVEPVDDGLGRERLVGTAAGRRSIGETGSRRLGVHHRESTGDPLGDQAAADPRAVGVEAERRWRLMGRGRLVEFVLRIPNEIGALLGGLRIVRAGLVDDGDLQAASGLLGPGDMDMHAVASAVAIGIELRLDPERLAHPFLRIGEGLDHLRLSVEVHRRICGGRGRADTGDHEQRAGTGPGRRTANWLLQVHGHSSGGRGGAAPVASIVRGPTAAHHGRVRGPLSSRPTTVSRTPHRYDASSSAVETASSTTNLTTDGHGSGSSRICPAITSGRCAR